MAKYSKTTSNKNGGVTYETGNHICDKEVVLSRINLLLFGNGKIEDGMAFQFKEFMKDHKTVVNNIEEIRNNVKDAIDSSGKAIRAIDSYKLECESFEKGKDEAEGKQIIAEGKQKIADDLKRQKNSDHWQRWIWIIMAFFAFSSVILVMYFGFRNLNKGQKEIKGETKITNEILDPPGKTRGMIIIPINDSTKKDSIK